MNKMHYSEELRKKEMYDNQCPIVYALNLIKQKWKLPILWKLASYNMLHYNELKRHVSGITNTMLTRCLRELEADGLIKRIQYRTIPPSVEYRMSERGKTLLPALNELYCWGEEQINLKKQK